MYLGPTTYSDIHSKSKTQASGQVEAARPQKTTSFPPPQPHDVHRPLGHYILYIYVTDVWKSKSSGETWGSNQGSLMEEMGIEQRTVG